MKEFNDVQNRTQCQAPQVRNKTTLAQVDTPMTRIQRGTEETGKVKHTREIIRGTRDGWDQSGTRQDNTGTKLTNNRTPKPRSLQI